MKKILFSIFTLALATMAGCQKSDIDDTLNNPTNSESKITVTANIVSDGQTRVALTPETDGEGKPVVKIDWKNGGEAFNVYGIDEDPIKVYGPETFTQSEGSLFSGNNPYQHSLYYYATYPASNLITVQKVADEVSIIFNKSNFTSQNGKLSEERTLMWASVSNLDENTKFNFEHLTSLLMPKFRVQGATENLSPANIASITFKSMLVSEETADFEIDCSELGAEDDIYVYLPQNSAKGKNKIEIVVTTNDEKVYDGEIDLGDATLEVGKLYTANIWLTKRESTNVITYTTTDNNILTLSNAWGEGDNCIYYSHTFTDNVGRIILKENITTLPQSAFTGIQTLANVTLSEKITTINAYAFQRCRGLETVVMPNVITVGESAFDMYKSGEVPDGGWGSSCLKNADLSKIKTFGKRAFYECQMTKIDLSGATSIGEKAVAALNQLTSVTMPKQDCTIGKQSFAACEILTTIDLTNASAIGETAFQSCDNLTAVFINRATPPTIVVKNGKTPFDQCNAALTIYVPQNYIANYEGSPLYSFIDKGANTIIYTTTDNTTLTLSNAAWGEGEDCIYTDHSFANNVGKIILKSGVTTLPANAFAEQYTLKSFVLPMCITTVSDSAFRKCYNLESISMPNVTVIGAEAFSMEGCPAGIDLVNTLKITHLDLSNVETFGAKAFYHVSSITSIDISGAINIGNEALGQLGRLTSVTMPAKGNNCVLGKSVFTQSASLIKIDLSGVQEMGAWQFTNSQNLKTIIIDRDTPPTIVADENGDKKLWWNQHNYLNQKIYVPNDLVTTYQQHEDWSQYANKIKPISEMPQ